MDSRPTASQASTGLDFDALRSDLEGRLLAGERVPVEDFIPRLSNADLESVIDLIFCEFLIREKLGERPEPDEYTNRFPQQAAVLRDQIALHLALVANPTNIDDLRA